MRQIELAANGVRFAALEQGAGKLALCLHGFPDCAWNMAGLMEALAGAGYRAVAPFMRGYAPTEVPADGLYRPDALGADAVALIEALGAERAVVIGHDWGAAAAYAAALAAPGRIERLVAMAVPYGLGVVMRMIGDPVQQRRSWYMYLLAGPLGEAALAAGDFALVERLWADWSPGFTPQPAQLARVRESLSAPGAALAAASYYKQLFAPEMLMAQPIAGVPQYGISPITVPSLYLHGAQDGCVGAEIGVEPAQFTAGLETEIVPGAGHFLHLEAPDVVHARILRFLSAAAG